jgi:hypothetical protein
MNYSAKEYLGDIKRSITLVGSDVSPEKWAKTAGFFCTRMHLHIYWSTSTLPSML